MSDTAPIFADTYASRADRIAALMLRERQSRFAASAIGYVWAFLTPAAWIALVVIVFHLLNRFPPIYVEPEIFVATGILPYLVFRQTITSMSRSVVSARHMLFLRPVSMNEIMLASALLDFINMAIAAIVIFGAINFLFDAPTPRAPAGVALAMILAWCLGTGLGRLAAVLVLVSDSFSRSIPILLRPLFWLSGIFYTAGELSGSLQDALWFSPTFHVVELLRESYFNGYVSPISNIWYPLSIAAGLWLLSVPIERAVTARSASRYRI